MFIVEGVIECMMNGTSSVYEMELNSDHRKKVLWNRMEPEHDQ